jgi:hypothetical protein
VPRAPGARNVDKTPRPNCLQRRGCVYRKLKLGHNGDAVRQGWRGNGYFQFVELGARKARPYLASDAFAYIIIGGRSPIPNTNATTNSASGSETNSIPTPSKQIGSPKKSPHSPNAGRANLPPNAAAPPSKPRHSPKGYEYCDHDSVFNVYDDIDAIWKELLEKSGIEVFETLTHGTGELIGIKSS